MAKIYAHLIRKGIKSINDVPAGLKETVIAVLGNQSMNEAGEQHELHN